MLIRELLDRVKTRYGLDTDYKACKLLHVSQSRISQALKRDSIPDDDLIIEAANLLKLDKEPLLLEAQAMRTKSKEAAAILRNIAKQLTGAAASIFLALPMVYMLTHSPNSEAHNFFEPGNTVYYVKLLSAWIITAYNNKTLFFTLFLLNRLLLGGTLRFIKWFKNRS